MGTRKPTLSKRLEGMTRTQRMAEAVRLVMEEGWNQTRAAEHCGVSRSRVNVNVQEQRKIAEDRQKRSEAARAERVAAFERTSQQEPLTEPGLPLTGAAGVAAITEVDPAAGAHPVLPTEPGPVNLQSENPPIEVPRPELILPELVIPTTAEVLTITNETRRIMPPGQFVRTYFGDVICPDCGVHHDVPPFHDEILRLCDDPEVRRLLVNVAPYHAKSTIGTVYDTVYQICKDPNIRIAIVSKAERLGGNFLYQIKRFLTDPNLYEGGPSVIDDWGPFHSDISSNTWSKTEIYVTGRTSSEKDPTVAVFGDGAQIYGWRFDKMKFDDIADLENQKNPDRVAEQLRRATQEYASRVGKTGKLEFFGTRVSPGDIYSELQKLPAFHVLRLPCITDELEGKTLWPEHVPYAHAVEIRDSMSLEQFQLVYQNVDTMGVGAAFPLEVLEDAKDTSRRLGMYDPAWRIVLGVDPAGAGEQSGYTAMIVWGVDMINGRRYLVDMVNVKQMRAPQIKDQMIAFADQYPLTEVRVEMNGLQQQLFQYDFELVNKLTQRGIRLAPHTTGKNKWDPQFGVESMGPMFYNKTVSLPWGDVNSCKKVGQLIEQLAQFPMGQITDTVMALWFAELGARELVQRFRLPAFDERVRMPGRIRNKRRIVDFGAQEVRSPNEHEIGDPHHQKDERKLINVSAEGGHAGVNSVFVY